MIGGPTRAVVWEFWAAHRRGWLVLPLLVGLGVAESRIGTGPAGPSEARQMLIALEMCGSMIVLLACCDFTERDGRSGFTHFPRRLFTLPVPTRVLVTWPMICGGVAIVVLHVAWTTLVFPAANIGLPVRWPATVLATGMVCYQSIIWCLSGFRFLRMIAMSILGGLLWTIGFLPWMVASSAWPPERSEAGLTTGLVILAGGAYLAAMRAIRSQRRGSGSELFSGRSLLAMIPNLLPRSAAAPARPFRSPDRALFWLEARRSGWLLPASVLALLLFIAGPLTWINGTSEETVEWTLLWMTLLPILLAVPIGIGIAKPDFWALDLVLPPFLAVRPVTGTRILATKMKVAAASVVAAWALVLIVTPIWLLAVSGANGVAGDLWGLFRSVYGTVGRRLIPGLAVLAAMLATWRFLVGGLWLGMSGRPARCYSIMSLGLAAFLAGWVFLGWRSEHPERSADLIVSALPWLPWLLAIGFTVKVWASVATFGRSHARRLVSGRTIARYVGFWTGATGLLLLLAWLISPEVAWFRHLAMLAALFAVPLARVGAAPLALSGSRHG